MIRRAHSQKLCSWGLSWNLFHVGTISKFMVFSFSSCPFIRSGPSILLFSHLAAFATHGALERKGPIVRMQFLFSSWQQAWSRHDQQKSTAKRCGNISCYCLFSKCKQPFKLEACLFIVILALAWLPNANTNCTTLMLAHWNRVTFQMICCLLVCMYTLCQAQVCWQIGVASLLSLNLPRLQHCNIFLLYRWSMRFQFLNWLAKIAEVQ